MNIKKNIKKLIGIAIITLAMELIGCGTSSGYSLPSNNEHSIAKTRLKNIIEAIENKNKEGIKDMFSPNALKEATDMDAGIDYIMDIYKGKIISSELGTQSGDKSTDDGELQMRFLAISLLQQKKTHM